MEFGIYKCKEREQKVTTSLILKKCWFSDIVEIYQ